LESLLVWLTKVMQIGLTALIHKDLSLVDTCFLVLHWSLWRVKSNTIEVIHSIRVSYGSMDS